MAHYSEVFHEWRKAEVVSWVKRLTKAGYTASFKQITDSEGKVGHGAGSFGYNVRVEGDFEGDFWGFRRMALGLGPKRR